MRSFQFDNISYFWYPILYENIEGFYMKRNVFLSLCMSSFVAGCFGMEGDSDKRLVRAGTNETGASHILKKLGIGAGVLGVGTMTVATWRWLQGVRSTRKAQHDVEQCTQSRKWMTDMITADNGEITQYQPLVNHLAHICYAPSSPREAQEALADLLYNFQYAQVPSLPEGGERVEKSEILTFLTYIDSHLQEPVGKDAEAKNILRIFRRMRESNPAAFGGSFNCFETGWKDVICSILGYLQDGGKLTYPEWLDRSREWFRIFYKHYMQDHS